MRRRRTRSTTGGTPTDPLFADVELLMHCNGTDGSTTFVDSSSFGRTLTAVGNAQLSTTNRKFGSACALFDGTGDSVAAGAVADWKFLHDGSTDWTIEFFFRPDSFASERAIVDTCGGSSSATGIYVSVDAARAINVLIMRSTGGTPALQAVIASYPNDTTNYHYVAITHQPGLGSNQLEVFVDGVSIGTASRTASYNAAGSAASPLAVGNFNAPTAGSVLGRIDELRITSARRTISSTPTEEFLNS